MKMIAATLASFLLLAPLSHATVYLDAIDRDSIGMAVITSGPIDRPNRILTAEKGVGLVGWGGSVRTPPRQADSLIFDLMKRNESNESIQNKVFEELGDAYYRVSFISARNGIGFVLPPSGCREQECGYRTGRQFLLIGGGLENGVLDRASQTYSAIQENDRLSLPCKLLAGISEIVKQGGEVKNFTSAQIVVDDPKRNEILAASSLYGEAKSESEILANLRAKLDAAGFNCAAE